jgi:hypothetical protein
MRWCRVLVVVPASPWLPGLVRGQGMIATGASACGGVCSGPAGLADDVTGRRPPPTTGPAGQPTRPARPARDEPGARAQPGAWAQPGVVIKCGTAPNQMKPFPCTTVMQAPMHVHMT